MITCSVCHAWRPSKWEGYRYTDEEAPCIYVPDHVMFAKGTCSRASITKPKVEVTNDKGRDIRKQQDTVKVTAPTVKVNPSTPARVPAPLGLYNHQKEDVERFKDSRAFALFTEPGCGKSATALAIAAHQFRSKVIDALLVIAPNSVHAQWHRQEIPKWLDVPYDSQCLFGNGGRKEAYPFDKDPEVLNIICVNIDTFSTPTKWLEIVYWANRNKTMIVLDESTCIKTHSAKRTQRVLYEFNDTVRRGKTIFKTTPLSVTRCILTGTPVTNGPLDLHCMFEFLQPNYFKRNYYSFQNYFGMFTSLAVNDKIIRVPLTQEKWAAIKGIQEYGKAAAVFGCSEDTFNVIHSQTEFIGPFKHADELRELIKPISVFRLLKDCVDMPEQVYITREISLSPEQQSCYDSMVEQLIAEYAGHTTTALNKMTAMIRLQQISSGFICDKDYDNERDVSSVCDDSRDIVSDLYGLEDNSDVTPDDAIQWLGNKIPKLEAMYNDIDEFAKPLIVVTRFTAEAARIYDDLKDKHSCCLITGWKRIGTIDEFQEGKYQVMIANIAVINKGFNLQNSHVMLMYSNTFSLEYRLQGEGRIYRIGQGYPCEYYDYVSVGTVDEDIVATLRLKRNLLEYIRSADIEELVHV